MLIKRLKSGLFVSWLFAARFAAEKMRWRATKETGVGNPRVFYGHDKIPSRDERSGGAIIKFQDLHDKFPNTIKNANILYLVNSSLPSFPEMMVREAKRHGVIFVLNQNGVAYPAWHGPGWEKTNRPYRFLLEHADYVIFQSEFCRIGAERFLGPCRVPWEVLHNPVDTSQFKPRTGNLPGIRILLAGSHQHFYRVRAALEAHKRILEYKSEALLTIAGRYTWRNSELDCLSEARSFAKELGIDGMVNFSGGYTQIDAPELFRKHHLLMHTKYNDPCPRLVVEAMACGLPIVYSQSGGVSELVGDKAGIGIPSKLDWEEDHPPDSSELAKAAMQVIASLDIYAESARKRAETYFDMNPWRERHAAIFSELLRKKVC